MKIIHVKFVHLKSKYISLLCILSLLSASLWGCAAPDRNSVLSVQDTFIAFDTVVTLTLYGTNDASIFDDIEQLCTDYENLFSRTVPGSDVYRINHAGGTPVVVDSETLLLVKEALYYCELTDGAIDITIAPVKDLWDFSSAGKTVTRDYLPSDTALAQALSHVDYRCVQCDETASAITLNDPDAQIDLGFIAKGYIADRLKESLIAAGITSATINLGGNVLTIGTKPDGTPFKIGIEKPFETSTPIEVLSVEDQSVVTSGIYERYFQIDDTIYHHILDPQTGYPVDNNLLSVTIISDSSMEGDALSTSCLLLGLSKAEALIETMDGIDAIFITDDDTIYDTRQSAD